MKPETHKIMIRLRRDLWIKLRRMEERRKIRSVNDGVNRSVEMFIKNKGEHQNEEYNQTITLY